MKSLRILFALYFLLSVSCDEGYIDDISAVDPGDDTAAPTITITSPPSGNLFIPFTETSSDINISLSVSDDIELSSVTATLDGNQVANVSEFVDFRNISISTIIENLSVGNYTLSVSASDLSGKSSEVDVSFTVTNEYIPAEGEIFYMPFEEESFTDIISDTEGEGFGNPEFVDGVFGDALELDAANQGYVTFPATPEITSLESFTLSFWTRVDFVDEDDNGGIDGVLGFVSLSNSNGFWGNINTYMENGSNPSDGADMRVQVTNMGTGAFLTDVTDQLSIFNNWSHHVIVYDNASKSIIYYINGEEKSTLVVSWDDNFAFIDAEKIIIGCLQFQTIPSSTTATGAQGWASYLTGEIDEIKIFDRVLSPSLITDLFNANNPN
ncbi:MAG: LamG-like jellyroll fold domain-containing protein [Bacteroidota bacterium]